MLKENCLCYTAALKRMNVPETVQSISPMLFVAKHYSVNPVFSIARALQPAVFLDIRRLMLRTEGKKRLLPPALLFTRGFQDYTFCRCQDGIYVSPQGRLIEFYGRHSEPGGCEYCRGLVLTPEGALTAGFGGPVLYQA